MPLPVGRQKRGLGAGRITPGVLPLGVERAISLSGLDDGQKRQLMDNAHQTCPSSAATRGTIEVDLEIV